MILCTKIIYLPKLQISIYKKYVFRFVDLSVDIQGERLEWSNFWSKMKLWNNIILTLTLTLTKLENVWPLAFSALERAITSLPKSSLECGSMKNETKKK